jgi:hypothetical protein
MAVPGARKEGEKIGQKVGFMQFVQKVWIMMQKQAKIGCITAIMVNTSEVLLKLKVYGEIQSEQPNRHGEGWAKDVDCYRHRCGSWACVFAYRWECSQQSRKEGREEAEAARGGRKCVVYTKV